MKRTRFTIWAALLAVLAVAPLGYAQIYVSTTGNDTTGNGTAGNPYATVGKGVAVLNASGVGTDLLIAPGTYTEDATHLITLSGSAADPVDIRGNGGQPFLVGMWFVLKNVSHVRLRELDINANGVHPACVLAATVTSCSLELSHITGSLIGGDMNIQAAQQGMVNGTGGAEAGDLVVYACNGYYVKNLIEETGTSNCFLMPDSPTVASGLVMEDSSFTEVGTSSAPGSTNTLRIFSANQNLVIRRCRLDAAQYAFNPTILTGYKSFGLANTNWLIEDCSITCRLSGGTIPCISLGIPNTSGITFRRTGMETNGGVCVHLTRGYAFENFTFEDCFFRDEADQPPLSPTGSSGNGMIRWDNSGGNADLNHVVVSGCTFVGASIFRMRSDSTNNQDDFTWTNCTAQCWDAGFYPRFAPLTHWTIQDCSFTCLNCPLYLSGHLQDSTIEDSTFTIPDSARAQFAEVGAFSSRGDATTLEFNNLTIDGCTFIVQRPTTRGFHFSDNGSVNLTLRNSWIRSLYRPVDMDTAQHHENLLIENCRVEGPGDYLAKLSFAGAGPQTIRNCVFDGQGSSVGITVGDSASPQVNTGLVIDGCTIQNVGSVAGVNVSSSAPGVVVKNCVVSNISGGANGLQVLADSLLRSTTNVAFRNNTLAGVSGAAIHIEGTSHEASGNAITFCGDGITVSEGSQPGFSDILISRNCVYGASPASDSGIELTNPSAAASNLRVVNNSVLDWVDGIASRGANVQGLKVFNNILDGNTTGLRAAGAGNTCSFNGYNGNGANAVGVSVPGTGDVVSDPLFLSRTPGNPSFLLLSPTSPMVDAGSLDGVVPDPTPDTGDDIDIGCIESAASAVVGWRVF